MDRYVWVILVVNIGFAFVANSYAGELDGRTISRSREWEPGGCYKPSQPMLSAYDVDSYNNAVNEYNSYVDDEQAYINCISSEAADDLRNFQNIIEDSLSRLTAEVKNEIDEAKSDLDLSRSLLDR